MRAFTAGSASCVVLQGLSLVDLFAVYVLLPASTRVFASSSAKVDVKCRRICSKSIMRIIDVNSSAAAAFSRIVVPSRIACRKRACGIVSVTSCTNNRVRGVASSLIVNSGMMAVKRSTFKGLRSYNSVVFNGDISAVKCVTFNTLTSYRSVASLGAVPPAYKSCTFNTLAVSDIALCIPCNYATTCGTSSA